MIPGLRAVARRVDRLLRPGGHGLILLYHRIADEPSDPYGLCVGPGDFEEHLETIRSLGRPMSLPAMVRALRDGALPERALGVTFDDAYLDVLENGVPILERHDFPATVFVTTGAAGREREFWWDELEWLLLRSGRVPEVLELEVAGQTRRWELGVDAGSPPEGKPLGVRWHLHDRRTPTARHGVFRELYHLLRPLRDEERTAVLDRLGAWVGHSPPPRRRSRRIMSPEEVHGMAGDGLVDVGAHTGSHPDLTTLPPDRQREEIRRSRIELEAWVGRTVPGFAYPYGHYDDRSVEEVRRAGFGFACAGDHAPVRSGVSPLLLPRVDVPPGGGDALAKLVGRFLGKV